MTEPRVEAGDRALETPLEPNHHWKWFRAVGQEECPHKDQVWHKMEPELCRPCFYALKTAEAYAALIQSAMNAQERELLLLAGRLLESQSPEWGDVDGASIEEWLIDAGLLKQIDVTEPCDPENCVCAEFGFPTKCNRSTELGKRAERLLAERGEVR